LIASISEHDLTRHLARLLVIPMLLSAIVTLAPAQEEGEEPAPAAPAAAAQGTKLTRLQGSAYLDRRNGVVGASVLARPQTGDTGRLYLTSTDQKGRFKLDRLPEGDYRVEVRRDGLVPVTKDNVVLKFPFRAVVEVPMIPGDDPTGAAAPAGEASSASLVATILTQEGAPASEVTVRIVNDDGRADPRMMQSNDEGRAEFGPIAGGRWTLETRGLGFLPIRAQVELTGSTDLTLVMVPQPGDYEPSALELLPPERPIPPAGLVDAPQS
jgi:hypothetical protein